MTVKLKLVVDIHPIPHALWLKEVDGDYLFCLDEFAKAFQVRPELFDQVDLTIKTSDKGTLQINKYHELVGLDSKGNSFRPYITSKALRRVGLYGRSRGLRFDAWIEGVPRG